MLSHKHALAPRSELYSPLCECVCFESSQWRVFSLSGEETGVRVSCPLRWRTAGSRSVVHFHLPERTEGPKTHTNTLFRVSTCCFNLTESLHPLWSLSQHPKHKKGCTHVCILALKVHNVLYFVLLFIYLFSFKAAYHIICVYIYIYIYIYLYLCMIEKLYFILCNIFVYYKINLTYK